MPNFTPQLRLMYLASVLLAFLAASSAPTPLYRLYQEEWHFSSAILTVVFAVYAFGLLAALLTAGRLSDHVGRRPVLAIALVLEALSMGLFLCADGVPLLIAARLLQGVATGVATSVIGAALIDTDRERGPLLNSLSPLLGMACGALGSGLLAQYAPQPLHLVYAVLLGVFVLQAVSLVWVGETVSREPGALASLRPQLSIPRQARSALWQVLPVNTSVWAMGGFTLSLAPTVMRDATGNGSMLLGGVLVAALTLPGATAIYCLREAPPLWTLRLGTRFLLGGLLVFLLGMHLSRPEIIVLGTLTAGVGFGAGFLGAVRTVMPLADLHERAGLLAAFYTLSYLAFCVPALAAGFVARELGVIATTDGYGAAIVILCLFALVRMGSLESAPGASR
jgi:MFS family permease